MATLAFIDAVVSVDGNDLSSDGTNVTLDYSAEALEKTAFGDTTKIRQGGLKDWAGTLEFNQDFAASPNPDVDLFAAVGNVVAIALKATSSATSATNPDYQGQALITSYQPFGQGVGELAKATVTFEAAGNLSRVTS